MSQLPLLKYLNLGTFKCYLTKPIWVYKTVIENKQWILFVWSGSIPQLRISHKMSFDSFATKDSLSYAYTGKGIQENYWFEYGLLFARH